MGPISATGLRIALVVGIAANPARAAGPDGDGLGLWTLLFLGFGAVILLFQAIPAAILFGSMLRGLFRRAGEKAHSAAEVRREA